MFAEVFFLVTVHHLLTSLSPPLVRILCEVPEGSNSLLTILMHCLLFCCSVCNVWNVVSSQSRSSNDSRHCPLHVHGVRIDSLFSPLFLFQYSLSLVHKTIVLNPSFSCTELIPVSGSSPIPLDQWRKSPIISLRNTPNDSAPSISQDPERLRLEEGSSSDCHSLSCHRL